MYRFAWWTAFGALALVGLGLGLVHHPLWVVALTTVGAAGGATWARARRVRGLVALAAGAASGAVAGLLPVLEGGLVLVAMLLLASAPGALTAYDRWAEATPRASRTRWEAYAVGFAPAAPTLSVPGSARDLGDEQLRRAWHDSETTLRRTGPTLELVELRRRLLDEHDRRHPERAPGAGVDWDRLLGQA